MGDGNHVASASSAQSGSRHQLVELLAAMAMAVGSISMSISMAALVFSGPIETGLPRAITGFVIAGALTLGFLGLRSQMVPLAVVVQDGPAVVMVAVAAGVVSATGQNAVVSVFVLIGIATFVTGLAMWLMGRFRLGHLVRYIPNTVVAAFIAGTGWLLAKGGMDVMVGYGVELSDIGSLFNSDTAKFWLPGLALGVVIWLLGHLDSVPPIVMSLTVMASIGAFFAAAGLLSSLDAVEAGGWLIGPFPSSSEFALVSPSELREVDWGELVSSLPSVGGVVSVAVIALLLNVTGLEFVAKNRIKVDVELRETGLANMLISPLGSLPAFHALGDSVLAARLGAKTRLMPLVAAVAVLGFGVFGLAAAGYMPRMVVGGLLISVGLALLVEWLQSLFRGVHPIENTMSVAIVLVIAFVGILEGIAVGVISACAVFVVRYSRIDPVKRCGDGSDYRSRVDYSPEHTTYLTSKADLIMVFQLQGYLFFGSLTSLEDRVAEFLSRTVGSDEAGSVIFDFRHVTGIDSSAFELLARLAGQISEANHNFVIAGLQPKIQESLIETAPDEIGSVIWVRNLDAGLEHAERELTRWSAHTDSVNGELELSDQLLEEFEGVEFPAGHVLMEQGSPSDELMIVCEGYLTASRIDGDGVAHRLRRFGAGALVGEIGFVTGGERTAQVETDTAVRLLALTRAHFEEMLDQKPTLVVELQSYMLKGQARRITTISDGLARSLR